MHKKTSEQNHPEVCSKSAFESLYKATVEPILTYTLEVWYPYQVHLQTSVERVKKFAAKLVTNNLPRRTKNYFTG
jgi:hypothetical protein